MKMSAVSLVCVCVCCNSLLVYVLLYCRATQDSTGVTFTADKILPHYSSSSCTEGKSIYVYVVLKWMNHYNDILYHIRFPLKCVYQLVITGQLSVILCDHTVSVPKKLIIKKYKLC